MSPERYFAPLVQLHLKTYRREVISAGFLRDGTVSKTFTLLEKNLMKTKLLVFLCFLGLGVNTTIYGQSADWPQFRGPNGNGVVSTLNFPETWSESENVAWSVDLPGGGLSSPIVSQGKIFLTTAVGAKPPVSFMEGVGDMRPKKPDTKVKFKVVSYNLEDGKKLWESTIVEQQPKFPIHGSNSYATESPATDGKHVFVYFAAVGIVTAFDTDGNEVWRQEIGAYPTGNGFGTGSSLTLGDGNVFIQCDNDEKSFIVALDGTTGELRWRKEREGRTSWSTPLFWKNKKRNELIACGSGFVRSYDPTSGAELWSMTDVGMSFSASPAADDQKIYFGNSGPRSNGPLVAINNSMSGTNAFAPDLKAEGLEWMVMQAGPGLASPVAVNGNVYIPGRGKLTCYSTADGSVSFKERMSLGSMAASLWAAGDRIFMMDETGKTVVFEATDSMNIIATNQIADDLFWSTPAVAGDSLLLRGVKKLYCIR